MHQFLMLKHPDHHLYTPTRRALGAVVHGLCYTGCKCSGPLRPPYPALLSWSYSPLSLQQQCGGPLWKGSLVICHCDNAAVVAQVNKLHACDPQASHMLRCLVFLQAIYNCQIRAVHVAGVNNPGADELSHSRAGTFLNRYSQVSPTPSQVPLAWVKLICQQASDWTSAHWRAMLNDFWRRALQNQL